MKKIMILHRSDLFNLTSDLPIQEVEAEHFKIQIKDFNSASFIAFEEDGLLKILKNDRGACVTMPCSSFLMAVQMATTGSALYPFPTDKTGNPAPVREYFIPDGNSRPALPPDYVDFSVTKLFTLTKDGKTAPLAIGYDPIPKTDLGLAMGYAMIADEQMKKDQFEKELFKTTQYYGHHLLEDYNDAINSSVATAIEMGRPETPNFPETLSEAIVFFDHNFNEVPKLIFQHTEIHFTATLKISHPEIYANIKKTCGFWCQDTALYKNLSYIYRCDHEECLINTILKGIYRYRNAGRDRSGDFKDVINSYNPE